MENSRVTLDYERLENTLPVFEAFLPTLGSTRSVPLSLFLQGLTLKLPTLG